MKRLLLISQVFPPEPSPGALRPGYLARYLPEFGWTVTVLTQSELTPPFPVSMIRSASSRSSPARSLSGTFQESGVTMRALRAVRDAVLFPDAIAPWIPQAIRLGTRALQREKFSAIMSTALPASVHVIGATLAKRSGLPWIADYRDPWAGNSYVHRSFVRRKLEHVLERRLLRRAGSITTISEPVARLLSDFHSRNDVHVIPNAYDDAEWSSVPQTRPERFDFCFTGSMYDGRRSPDLLFAALAHLRRTGDPAGLSARVHFYGRNTANVSQSAAAHEVSLIVREHGTVPRAQAMRAQRASAALLIFLNMDERTAGEMGSKYLEYLGAHRPIIACGPPNSVMRSFIRDNGLGWFASTVDEAAAAIRCAYDRFRNSAYELAATPAGVLTSRDLARTFADILDAQVERSTAGPAQGFRTEHIRKAI